MDSGTGSIPPGAKGRQRSSRLSASHEPRITPWRSTASHAYAEQVGWNLQQEASKGEIAIL